MPQTTTLDSTGSESAQVHTVQRPNYRPAIAIGAVLLLIAMLIWGFWPKSAPEAVLDPPPVSHPYVERTIKRGDSLVKILGSSQLAIDVAERYNLPITATLMNDPKTAKRIQPANARKLEGASTDVVGLMVYVQEGDKLTWYASDSDPDMIVPDSVTYIRRR
jgi:hypothetical protein